MLRHVATNEGPIAPLIGGLGIAGVSPVRRASHGHETGTWGAVGTFDLRGGPSTLRVSPPLFESPSGCATGRGKRRAGRGVSRGPLERPRASRGRPRGSLGAPRVDREHR